MSVESWVTVLSAISAFFAAVAAIANWRQARKASQGNEVQVYIEMAKKWNSEEMRKSISDLAKFWRETDGDVVASFASLKSKNHSAADYLSNQTRILTSYFVDCARLYESGLISKGLFKIIALHPGLNVFYKVAVPIGTTVNPHHNAARSAMIIQKIIKSHGSGEIY